MIQNLKVYPTMLDSFSDYLHNRYDVNKELLLAKINRTDTFTSEAMFKGTAMHKITEKFPVDYRIKNGNYQIEFFEFKKSVVDEIAELRSGFYHEVYLERILQTKYGPVKLYGYADDLNKGIVQDVKTAGNYYYQKFIDSYQWKTYLFAANAHTCNYIITDYWNVYFEEYHWYPDIENQLRSIVEKYYEFLLDNYDLLTTLDKMTFTP